MKDFIQKHVKYLKNNPEGYWFKRKLYGWGWTPATKEGWIVILIFITLLVGNALRMDVGGYSESEVLMNFVPQTAILVIILIAICYKKGERPRWQWGTSKEDDPTP